MEIISKICLKIKQLSFSVTTVVILSITSSFATKSSCQESLENLFMMRNKSFFSLSKRFYKNVDLRFLKNEYLSSNEKAKRLFKIYIKKIKTRLSEAERRELNRLIKDKTYISSNNKNSKNSKYNGQYRFETENKKGHVSVRIPSQLKNSFLEYSIIAHELEHAIKQILSKQINVNYEMYKTAQSKNEYERLNFLDEMGAMSAEWLYLSVIPKKEIEYLKKVVKQIKDEIPAGEKRLLETALSAPKKTLREYLDMNWNRERYNYWKIKQERTDRDLNDRMSSNMNETYLLLQLAALSTGSFYIYKKIFDFLTQDEDEDEDENQNEGEGEGEGEGDGSNKLFKIIK